MRTDADKRSKGVSPVFSSSCGKRKGKIDEGFIFIISGPSGSGKTTLARLLLRQRSAFKGRLVKSVSLTTRKPRSAEKPGRDYFFVGKEDFSRLLKDKKILEWTKYLEYYYGTPKEFVENCLEKGKYLLMCLDHKGAMRVKRAYPCRSTSIFLRPPSLRVLEQRIRGRCKRTAELEIKERLAKAKREMRLCCRYDHCIVNGDLEQAVNDLKKIIGKSVTRKKGKARRNGTF